MAAAAGARSVAVMPVQTRRVVAVQLAVRPGEVERNLRHIADVVGQAVREHQPDMLFLPEVSCAPNLAHSMMGGCVRPVDGGPLAAYRDLACEHGCLIGGGALTIRGRDARNTYNLCEPDGSVHLHDKDQPSMWENVTYAAGEDEGVCVTADGPIGVPSGFEWIRTRTAARMRGRVRLVAGGMCFPSFPTWRVTRPYFWEREHGLMLDLARESPGRLRGSWAPRRCTPRTWATWSCRRRLRRGSRGPRSCSARRRSPTSAARSSSGWTMRMARAMSPPTLRGGRPNRSTRCPTASG
jgi:hypothetical protein